MYSYAKCFVRVNSHITEWFNVDSGEKDGCILSLLVFAIHIDWIMKKCISNTNTGTAWVDGKCLEELNFTDNIALLSNTPEKL